VCRCTAAATAGVAVPAAVFARISFQTGPLRSWNVRQHKPPSAALSLPERDTPSGQSTTCE
jgi:hypothetical protein